MIEYTEPEKWIPEAITQQEEYLKRQRPCRPAVERGGSGWHSWETYSPAPGSPTYEACWRCKVTKTDADYQTKTKTK